VDLDAVVEGALRLMEEASRPLAQAMAENRPEAMRAPVHAFTCAGTHMLYALLTAVHSGYAGRDRAERVEALVHLMVWRLRADPRLIERFYAARARQRGASWYEVDAMVKILGHAEECLAFATQRDLVRLRPDQEARRRAAVTSVRRMIADLQEPDLEQVRRLNPELFRQLVGDICHARHGLRFGEV
jgi:hypothetical protein